jgi:phage terminase large subunit-like protein
VITLTDKQSELRVLSSGKAKHILAVGGARSGKTFAVCYFIDRRAWKAPGSRHLIYRKHAVAVKQSIGADTMPKIHELTGAPIPKWYAQDAVFRYANGSEIWLCGFDDNNADKMLGREYATLYGNEVSETGYSLREQVLTRLAQSVDQVDGRPMTLREFCDLNPTTTAHWSYKLWMMGINPASEKRVNPEDYAALFINPGDNRENLPATLFDTLENLSERARRRFLLGQYSAESEDGLWRRNQIQRIVEVPGPLDRIVIAIDPAVSTNIGSDETGIVAAGMQGAHGGRKGYLLEDASGKFRPEEWARVALNLYHQMDADCIVAEVNQGGDMVESVIRSIEAHDKRRPARIKLVHATKGKVTRAEPIVGLYERKLIYHVGEFPSLEDQMVSFTIDFDRKSQGYSPDRLDAMVWAFSELFPAIAVNHAPRAKPIANPKPRFFA